ncbi:type II secretion system GspH family protein [Patescibacteria group bacterium]|nr:type II secretion system GspH family protein [Patescibacteria group bacterium]
MTKNYQNQFGGFTIIDLLVSVSIFVVITGLTLSNFSRGRQKDDLRQGSLLVVSLLQQAQVYALAGQTINGFVPAGGYGLNFDLSNPGRLIFFADLDDNGLYSFGGDSLVDTGNYNLSTNVTITNLVVRQGETSQSSNLSNFIYRPPQAARYLDGLLNGGTLEITLRHSQTGETKLITVSTASGQVNTQ